MRAALTLLALTGLLVAVFCLGARTGERREQAALKLRLHRVNVRLRVPGPTRPASLEMPEQTIALGTLHSLLIAGGFASGTARLGIRSWVDTVLVDGSGRPAELLVTHQDTGDHTFRLLLEMKADHR